MRIIPLVMLLAVGAGVAEAKPRNVAILVYDHAEILDFAGPAEVLSAAGSFAGQGGKSALNVYLVGRTTDPVKVQGFIKIVPEYSIANAPKPDIVVIPGGMSDVVTGDPEMMKWIASVTASNEVTLTVCTGAFPLAKLGALDGKTVTTYYGAVERMQKLAPKAKVTHGLRFVDNGKIITTAGVSAGIDGALHLTARLLGRRVADQTARYMEYHWTPEPYLAKAYSYWNPSLDDRGRAAQAADALIEEKRFGEAIAAYKRLTEGDTTGLAWVGLGDALFQSGDHKGSIAAYQRVTAKSPSYALAIYNLACAYAQTGRKAEALAAIKQAFAAGASREHSLHDPDLAAIHADIKKL